MSDYPVTPAVRFLKAHGVDFEPLLYDYVEKGGTRRSSAELGVDEHHVVKTLVMQDDLRRVFLVLMHGDRKVSTKKLARDLGVKSIEPAPERAAEKATGYRFGGTSPFGTTDASMRVYVERSILALDWIVINGGKRGFLVRLAPGELQRVLPTLTPVDVATVEA